MDAETNHAHTMRSDRSLNEASKRITRIETVRFFGQNCLDYADVIVSFSGHVPSCDAVKKFVGKEFVIGQNTFRIFAVEDLPEDIRIDGSTCNLKVRCVMKERI